MRKVTFKSRPCKALNGKTFINIEYTEADDAALKLRALALNWDILSIEVMA